MPALLVELCAGVLIDRVNRRTCSIISDLVSAAAVVAIPLVDLATGLTISWLVALAILGSFGDVPGMTARQVMVPVVARDAGVPLERLIGLRQSMTSAALVIGPAAADTLLTLFNGSTVLFVTAATSSAALVTVTLPPRLRQVESAAANHDSLLGKLTAGAAALRGSRFLISTVTLTVGLAVALGGLQGLVLPLYFSELSRPDLLGFVLTALAVGMLVGTTVFAAVSARMSRRRWLVGALSGTTTGFLLLATLAGPGWVFAGAALFGIGNSVLGAELGVLQAQRIPDRIRGRVLSLQNACLQVAVPAGVGLASLMAEWDSPVAAGLALFAFWLSVLVLAGTVSRQSTDV